MTFARRSWIVAPAIVPLLLAWTAVQAAAQVSFPPAQPHSLKTRVGLGYGQENRLRQPTFGFATADAETAYRWALSKTAELREDTTFTTDLQRGTDWRFANVWPRWLRG